ncbi:MAG TPA: YraN family protein [Dehalococcoidia bacterium]|nr:YraN family protein [Dehalococcoidia bacterium]
MTQNHDDKRPAAAGPPRRPDTRRALGAFAERLAAGRLERAGYRIVGRNARAGPGEIDIVALKDGQTVLVEVRARREGDLGSALWSITPAKRRHLLTAAEQFLAEHPELPQEARIDLAAVTLDRTGKVIDVQIVENAIEG